MKQDYESRLRVPIGGDPSVPLFTSTGLKVASGFARVVIGGRGPYVEFSDQQVVSSSLFPVREPHYYYDEWRTPDSANVKFYHQKFRVDYADYLPGMWYATPFELFLGDGTVLIEPIRRPEPPSLFD